MKISKSVFLITGITGAALFFCAATQRIEANTGGPLPPPVEIELTTENTSPLPGQEIILHLKVTPLEDMHADISCLLPEGVSPVMEPGLMLHPVRERHLYTEPDPSTYQPIYREAVGLWVGPMAGGETKEFVFRVIISDKGSYQFTAVVEALAKWGVKQEVMVIDIK